MKKAMKHLSANLEVLPSPLLLEQMEHEAAKKALPFFCLCLSSLRLAQRLLVAAKRWSSHLPVLGLAVVQWISLLSCLGRRRRRCAILQGCLCCSRLMTWRFHVRGQVLIVAVHLLLPFIRGAPSCVSAGE
ncbi:hypothetical protein ATANTOWER_027942 [Ataeniobius toweri]|uniref:Uncharacterized protein n=1 Tax=Ataeniobius toweri TaxID=208326 RepID=A0ABU7CKX1_9TELE|nr:hypothetical protein [Ataeniobius toweri]